MSENNLVVLRGTLVSEPRSRELPSGSVLVQFDVTTRDEGGAQPVPVAWFEPAARGVPAAPGDEIETSRVGGETSGRVDGEDAEVPAEITALLGQQDGDTAIVAHRFAGPVWVAEVYPL